MFRHQWVLGSLVVILSLATLSISGGAVLSDAGLDFATAALVTLATIVGAAGLSIGTALTVLR